MNALVLDTSPLLALYLGEPTAGWVVQQMQAADRLMMTTVNLAECLIVLRSRKPTDFDEVLRRLLTSTIDFVPPDASHAAIVADARVRYPLNLGDCFAYALAKSQGIPLLTLDRDFRNTDIAVRLPA